MLLIGPRNPAYLIVIILVLKWLRLVRTLFYEKNEASSVVPPVPESASMPTSSSVLATIRQKQPSDVT